MKKSTVTAIIAGVCFLILILDAKTALQGASDGVRLCIQALIPSLFPFFILSMLLTSSLMGQSIPFLSPIGRLCGMPKGSESMLLVGLLGGYPVGAQSVAQSFVSGQLSKADAHRLLGFCNNAGPAFLFGIVASRFSSMTAVWVLWAIHILSALITGILLPGKSENCTVLQQKEPLTLSKALERSIKVMGTVCGWVVLFRIMIAFFTRWFLWLFPGWIQTLLIGLTELTNGCYELGTIEFDGLRFVIASGILSLGGLCVAMQTISVTGKLGTALYFPGKAMQSLVSLILAGFSQYFLFPAEEQFNAIPLMTITATALILLHILLKKKKKVVAFPTPMVYNREKDNLEVFVCSFGSGSKSPAPTASSAQS